MVTTAMVPPFSMASIKERDYGVSLTGPLHLYLTAQMPVEISPCEDVFTITE
jgi:hypothetical protein